MKNTLASFGLLATLLVFSENVAAQDALFEQFLGSWSGSGQLFGAPAKFDMTWERALDGQFVRLTFRNSFKDSGGRDRMLKAQAFYKATGARKFIGTWFDSRGMILPLKSTFEDSVLTTHWGEPESEEGRTVYRFVARDRIKVEDFINTNGEWRKFGHAVYHRESRE